MFSLAPVVVSKLTKIPHIVEVNGVIGEELKMVGVPRVFVKSFEFVEKHIYKFSQRIITVTKNIKKELVGKYALSEKKIIVVPNGANTDLFRPLNTERAKKELDLDDKSFYVIFVGYLVQWQGVDRLIEAAPFVLKEVPNTKFIIVGEGRILNALKAQVEELNITDKFTFTGKVPYEIIPLYINACDVCAAPFIRERNEKIGLSAIKVYEYLACGKPLVASNIEGVGDLLEISKSGIPVEPGNCEDLGGGIVKLLEDKKLRDRMGKNGRKLVEEKYSWRRAAQDVVRVCEEVVLN
jgi:glycosyltransferase involved in cell wall biosynthesis